MTEEKIRLLIDIDNDIRYIEDIEKFKEMSRRYVSADESPEAKDTIRDREALKDYSNFTINELMEDIFENIKKNYKLTAEKV